jgi:uncharacterized membrane protein YqjE
MRWDTWIPELKVDLAAIGALLGGVIVWALNTYVFYSVGPPPGWVDPILDAAIPLIVAAIAGWWTSHTPRPDAPIPHTHPGLGDRPYAETAAAAAPAEVPPAAPPAGL